MSDNLREDKNTNQREELHIKTTTKKLQAPRSRIWEQFKRLPEDLAVCKICNRFRILMHCLFVKHLMCFFQDTEDQGWFDNRVVVTL